MLKKKSIKQKVQILNKTRQSHYPVHQSIIMYETEITKTEMKHLKMGSDFQNNHAIVGKLSIYGTEFYLILY